MAEPEDFIAALKRAGRAAEWVVEDPGDPGHIAVPLSDDCGMLRINQLESSDEVMAIWQLVFIFPAVATSEHVFDLARAALNTVNNALFLGKVIAAEDEEMLYFSYNHVTHGAAGLDATAPFVVDLICDLLEVLSPPLCTLLEADTTPDESEADGILTQLSDAEAALEELLAGFGAR